MNRVYPCRAYDHSITIIGAVFVLILRSIQCRPPKNHCNIGGNAGLQHIPLFCQRPGPNHRQCYPTARAIALEYLSITRGLVITWRAPTMARNWSGRSINTLSDSKTVSASAGYLGSADQGW
ncbi:MAG: hypothetical protein OSA51_14045 [Octadecabacter sp.]|nr:hypothetical protein [Octadecabacter sp.]